MKALILIAVAIPVVASNSPQHSSFRTKTVVMTGYEVRIPSGWYAERDTGLDRVGLCNAPTQHCTGTGGGFPLRHRAFVLIAPTDKLPTHSKDAASVVNEETSHNATGVQIETEVVDLGPGTKCLCARKLLLGVWNEVCGLEVGGRVFRSWAQFNNEGENVARYRQQVKGILASLRVRTSINSAPER